MSAVTFDTLKFVETLEAAKITGEQARAIAAAVRDVQQSADLATKGDVAAVQADVLAVRTDMASKADKADIARLDTKIDMLKWMLVLVTALTIAPFIKSMF